MIHEMMDLPNPLLNAEIQQCQATQVFWSEGNAARKMLVHPQFVQNGWNRSALNLVQLQSIKCSHRK
jgi:hypothetical protein